MTYLKKCIFCLQSRPPFSNQLDYCNRKSDLLSLSLEMATCAQRDRFAERPVEELRVNSSKMATLADSIVRDIKDPLLLQPASLELVTLKKRSSDDLVCLHSIMVQFNSYNCHCNIYLGTYD